MVLHLQFRLDCQCNNYYFVARRSSSWYYILWSMYLQVKTSRGPINGLSLHIPLHRTLSAIISKLVLMTWGEADQGFLSELQADLSEVEVCCSNNS